MKKPITVSDGTNKAIWSRPEITPREPDKPVQEAGETTEFRIVHNNGLSRDLLASISEGQNRVGFFDLIVPINRSMFSKSKTIIFREPNP